MGAGKFSLGLSKSLEVEKIFSKTAIQWFRSQLWENLNAAFIWNSSSSIHNYLSALAHHQTHRELKSSIGHYLKVSRELVLQLHWKIYYKKQKQNKDQFDEEYCRLKNLQNLYHSSLLCYSSMTLTHSFAHRILWGWPVITQIIYLDSYK